MSETNDPDYKWRPATKGDIGSIARFGDTDDKHEPWSYGILKEIESNKDFPHEYICEHGGDMDNQIEGFLVCQIQYDANKEP